MQVLSFQSNTSISYHNFIPHPNKQMKGLFRNGLRTSALIKHEGGQLIQNKWNWTNLVDFTTSNGPCMLNFLIKKPDNKCSKECAYYDWSN